MNVKEKKTEVWWQNSELEYRYRRTDTFQGR